MARSTIRLREALWLYLDGQRARQRSKNTIYADEVTVGKFVRITKDIQVSSVTPEHVERFFYGPGGIMGEHVSESKGRTSAQGVSAQTHNHYRSRLKVFFTWCYTQGYITRDNLMSRVEPMKVTQRVRQRPSPRAMLSLLDHASNERDRCFLAVSINTALRSNEIVRMRIKDLDLEAGFLYVVISKTKTEDELPISSDLDPEIRRWLVAYAENIGRPLEDDDYLFPGCYAALIRGYDEDGEIIRDPIRYYPERPMGSTHLAVQKALRAIGLPTKGEGTHTLRRAVARAYFDQVAQDKGDVAALRETASLLHHQSLATTERYLGTTPERENRDRRLRGKPFLSAMVEQDNVVQLPVRVAGE